MNREDLLKLIRKGPVQITTNDGKSFDVPNIEHCLVSEYQVYVMIKENGKFETYHLPIHAITHVKELSAVQ